jgi:hypothetical protein
MKSVHYVPPVVALIIAAAWLADLRGSNRALEQDNLSLDKKIERYRRATVLQNERVSTEAMRIRVKREKNHLKRKASPPAIGWAPPGIGMQSFYLTIMKG